MAKIVYFDSMKLIAVLLLFSFAACNDQQQPQVADHRQNDHLVDSPLLAHQSQSIVPVDISPMDIAYMPSDYPIQKMSGTATGLPVARVIYSRPHRQGRTIFGGLIKYGEPWRLGANEATEIEFFQPVTIEGKKIPKGRYSMYAIPQEKSWTIIFSSNLFSWGLKQDRTKDVYQFQASVQNTDATLEYFTMMFEKTDNGADLVMAWEDQLAKLPIQF